MGSGGEAPRRSGVLYVKLSSDEHILYLNCDTGRSRICVGSRGGAPGNSGVLGNKLLSDEHAFYTFFGDNGRSPIGVGVQGAEPQEAQGFWAINNCQMSMLLYLIW